MIGNESIMHHYAMAIVYMGLVVIVGMAVIALIWAKWVKNR